MYPTIIYGGVMELSQRRRTILSFINEHIAEEGAAPTLREIAARFGITLGPAQRHVGALIEGGYLKHGEGRSRGVKPMARLPVLGRVPAGLPLEAVESIEDYIYVDKAIVKAGTYFALKVKGDSMINAGIYDGDTVVVRHQPAAEDGEIVVAKIEGEATVKRLRKKNDAVFLQPENPHYPIIRADNIEIVGKVVYLTRKI
jgi:repressor LexA